MCKVSGATIVFKIFCLNWILRLLTCFSFWKQVVRHFELLGAAIGDDAFVPARRGNRAAQAGDFLDAVGELEDPQVALRLLRASAGFARMLHSIRCNTPAPQTLALDMFDGMVRRRFGDFTGLHPSTLQWKQISLGLAHGGLGLRSTLTHDPAAFLASLSSTLASASELDAGFSIDEAKASPEVAAALSSLNAQLAGTAGFSLDAALAGPLWSEASAGGRAFLLAAPVGRTRMEPAAFISELRARLQIPDADVDSWCPRCDAVPDTHSYHAGSAPPEGSGPNATTVSGILFLDGRTEPV
eukprot:s101_g35.t1